MKERKLTSKEMFKLTTGLIGHCSDEQQIRSILSYVELRLHHLTMRKGLAEKPKRRPRTPTRTRFMREEALKPALYPPAKK